MNPRKIYVAGPLFGSGIATHNVRRALDVANSLRKLGAIPFIPHLFVFWDLIHPHEPDYWLTMDYEWLLSCDAIYCYAPNEESPGTDQEKAWSKKLGIPIYDDWNILMMDIYNDQIPRRIKEKC